jgi:hypothetical protein
MEASFGRSFSMRQRALGADIGEGPRCEPRLSSRTGGDPMKRPSSRTLVLAAGLATLTAATAWSDRAYALQVSFDPFGDQRSFAVLASDGAAVYVYWSNPATGQCVQHRLGWQPNKLDDNVIIDLAGGDDTFISLGSTTLVGCGGSIDYRYPVDPDGWQVKVYGSGGNDDIEHNMSGGVVLGGSGNDWIRLNHVNMYAQGESGNDTIIIDWLGAGAVVSGGTEDDRIVDYYNKAVVIDCGPGADRYTHTGSAYLYGCETYVP